MLDDHDTQLRTLPAIRVFDRGELERYLATLEAHAEVLQARLEAARERRVLAERARAERVAQQQRDLAGALMAAQAELAAEAERHETALAQLRREAADEARRILRDAEREALDLRVALEGVLEGLGAGSEPTDVVAPARLVVVPGPVAPEPAAEAPAADPLAPAPVLRPAVSLGRRAHPSNKLPARSSRRYPLRTG